MMHLGLSISPFGHHPQAWRGKDADAFNVAQLAAQVSIAQDAGFDFVLFADCLGQRPSDNLSPLATPFEPTTLVAALATLARKIGLVATAATSQHEPYNLARRFASLDTISAGRCGWNLVNSDRTDGWDDEYATVVAGLWDSWDDDAFVYDKAQGRFFIADRMHVLNHIGPHFSVRGPLNVNRSPQGRPLVTHVLTPGTWDLAARFADVIVIAPPLPETATRVVTDLRRRIADAGRDGLQVKILATVIPWVDGQADFQRLQRLSSTGTAQPDAGWVVVGSPIDIADALQHWFTTTGIDGFVVEPPVAPEGTEAFIHHVVPELRRRQLFRDGYAGTTLRDHLGLARPALPVATAKERAS